VVAVAVAVVVVVITLLMMTMTMLHQHIQGSVPPFFWTFGSLFLKHFQAKHFQEFLQQEKIIQ
jgi:hypothetical protein